MLKLNFKSILNNIFLVPLLYLYSYDTDYIYSIAFYSCHSLLFYLSKNSSIFCKLIKPANYIKSNNECHKLIAYSFSAIHATYLAIMSSLYIYNYCNDNYLSFAFKISIGYYLTDCSYIIKTEMLKYKLNMDSILIMIHHLVVIYYELVMINKTTPLYNDYIYYMSKVFMCEYSVLPLNYCWYLVNTNQAHTRKFIISSAITLLLFFITRVVNFTNIIIEIYYDGLIEIAYVGLLVAFINYFWFYKLLAKVAFS